jgi:hypothetical protein
MVAVIGEMETDAIDGLTVSVTAVLVMPAVRAVIWLLPGATPVAIPAVLMVAMLGELLVQVKVCPPTVVPLESSAVAVNCCCPFTLTELVVGVTFTDATVSVLEEPPHPGRSASRSEAAITRPRKSDEEQIWCRLAITASPEISCALR